MKRSFSFGVVLRRIRAYLQKERVANAAMFELAARGHRSLFEQLVGCVISIRTLDEVSLPVALELFASAPTPQKVAALSVDRIDRLIRASSFHRAKAATIREIGRRTSTEFNGKLPCDADVLTSFKGVGPKCANLALGVACGEMRISVDDTYAPAAHRGAPSVPCLATAGRSA